ncbi:hypothetical protein LTR10_001462 [Elasticomyces elasticus]|uniref:Uncharacterized protein n=1 Tax=Elasticomyces elasticus TaxID=574655 RepID=A0AAN7WCV2_9PEZI|nr:hypothetical protein LTR10_001462 [Elasticomyces elasticus]KAK4974964.1 hypothetical protein LTR42_004173 [Elasticomyces elasticus]KAK5706832.1 hypothetical protein LTR97_001824 [Elasticomyces elasticus]
MKLTERLLDVEKPSDVGGAIIEAWAQGFMVGALIIMMCVTFSNMRRGVLLHKLILIELLFGCLHGTFIFTNKPVYNWYLSVTAIFLNISWSLHNVIAWIKNKPFLPRWGSILYITTVLLVQPYWVLEIAANFLYFSDTSNLFTYTRPYEALFRDPWWIFTVLSLLYNIRTRYEFGYIELMRVSPRFAIIVDILAVTHVISGAGLPDGINPFWKLAFVFKCLTDTIILDDFKTALDRLKQYKLERVGSIASDNIRGEFVDVEQARHKKAEQSGAVMEGSGNVVSKDWMRSDNIDLASALRMDYDPKDDVPSSTGG